MSQMIQSTLYAKLRLVFFCMFSLETFIDTQRVSMHSDINNFYSMYRKNSLIFFSIDILQSFSTLNHRYSLSVPNIFNTYFNASFQIIKRSHCISKVNLLFNESNKVGNEGEQFRNIYNLF